MKKYLILIPILLFFRSYSSNCRSLSFIGDSNMVLFYLRPNVASQLPKLTQDERFVTKISQRFHTPVYDFSNGGSKTEDYLGGGKYQNHTRYGGYYIVSLGLNDAKNFYQKFNHNHQRAWSDFKQKTRMLITQIKAYGGKVVLMTGTAFDYPKHHHYDQESIMWGYNQTYRDLSREMGLGLIDVNTHLKNEIRAGRWDIHIRRSPGQYILDARFDRGKENNPQWFSESHYNLRASRLIEGYISYWLRTQTSCK